MKCDRVQRLISDSFERRLTVEESMEIREHIQTCVACAAFDRRLHVGLEAIHRLPDITPSRKLWESVHTLTATQARATPRRVAHQALGIAGAALTVALVAVVTILLFNNHTAVPPPTGQAAIEAKSTAPFAANVPNRSPMSALRVPATPKASPSSTGAPAATPPASAASATPATVYTTPEPPALDNTAAENTVVAYFHAINVQDYAMAYAYLGTDLQQLQTYTNFASGYADTVHDTVITGTITPRQTNELAVPLHLDAQQSDGTTRRYDGTYVVGIEGNVLKIVDAQVTEEDDGTPVASRVADTTTCLAKNLKASASYQGATGSMAGSIIFTYGGSGTCILSGTPDVQIIDGNGNTLKTTQVSTNLGATQTPIVLENGQQAALLFTWSNWCPDETSSTSAATPDSDGITFVVTLAKSDQPLTVPALQSDGTPITSLPRCDAGENGSTLSVSGFSRYPES